MPKRWLKTFLSIGDKCVDHFLGKICGKTTKCQPEDVVAYYDNYRRTWAEINFENKFSSWTRSDLIKQIKMYETEKHNHKNDKLSWKMSREEFLSTETKALGQAFDKAFK